MRHASRTLTMIALALGTSACGFVYGALYHDVAHPPVVMTPAGPTLDTHLNRTENGREVAKSGRACAYDILKLVAWGDNSQAAAAKAGALEEIDGVDFEVQCILGIVYTRVCTIAYGR